MNTEFVRRGPALTKEQVIEFFENEELSYHQQIQLPYGSIRDFLIEAMKQWRKIMCI